MPVATWSPGTLETVVGTDAANISRDYPTNVRVMTGMLTARNIVAGHKLYDVWKVNQDAEYLESGPTGEAISTSGLRMVPSRVREGKEGRAVPRRDP